MEENRSCCVHYAGDAVHCGRDITDSSDECENCGAKICDHCFFEYPLFNDARCHYCNEKISNIVCVACRRAEDELDEELNYCYYCKAHYCSDCALKCDICLINNFNICCPIHTKFFSISNSKVKKICKPCFSSNVNDKNIVHCKDHDLLIFWDDNIHKKCCKNKVII